MLLSVSSARGCETAHFDSRNESFGLQKKEESGVPLIGRYGSLVPFAV